MARKMMGILFVLILCFSAASCGGNTPLSSETASQATGTALTPTPGLTPLETLTPSPLSTPTPLPTPEIPDSVGSGDVLFDIYQNKALRDINFDGVDEEIGFIAGESGSKLFIDGTPYSVPQTGLAQLFAITDVDKNDDILELVFTETYDPALPESEFAFSWLYWWNGTEIINMGGLMDVKFDGKWKDDFVAADHFDAGGTVACLTETDEFTYILYMGHYVPSGDDRKLKEKLYATVPIGEPIIVRCKQPCLLLENITSDYYSSAYDYYWIPTLWPYTAGRVPNVSEGIVIIAQTDEYLTIVKVYGKKWFKLKTSDGYSGWIRCEDYEIDAYAFTMGWDAYDMFGGL